MPVDLSPALLIVDDVAENIQIVAGILKNQGYDMAFATNGKAAVDIARNNDFDLVLLDVMMPEMDGFEVCEELKASRDTAASTVIFLTAKTDVDSIIRGFDLGGNDFITKPFNAAELLARVRTHVDLRLKERKLQQMNAEKDRFISIIAQEIKGPLGGINGVLRMVDDDYDALEPKVIRDYLTLSRKASDQLQQLLDNLLTWSTMRTEGLPYTPRTIDLATIVSDTVEVLLPTFKEKWLALKSSLSDGQFVFADEEMVGIVVRNLLVNAVMFTDKGGKISISGSSDDKYCTVSVTDTGRGLGKDEIANLFQIDKRTKRKGTNGEMGTGMGLILCRELLEKNGGMIWLESEPEKGTTVFFKLPKTLMD